MNVLVLGGGFLGMRVAEAFDAQIITDRITDEYELSEVMANGVMNWPHVIINCIGKTGRPNVDSIENEKPETYISNVHVPYLLAEFCKRNNIKLVHISSGCVYRGDNGGLGWSESDRPNFDGSFYSFSKSAAERILSAYPEVLTLRMRMPVSGVPGSRDLIGKLLRYTSIVNTPNSISVVDDFIGALKALVESKATGVYNVCNPEPVTHKQILDIYEELSGKKLGKTYINANELVTDAPRSNCVLNVEKVQQIYKQRPTIEALRDVISKYIQNGG